MAIVGRKKETECASELFVTNYGLCERRLVI